MTSLLKSFLEIVVLSSLMICMTLLIKRLFAKRVTPRLMAVLWIIVLFRLVVPVLIDTPVSLVGKIVPIQIDSANSNTLDNSQDTTHVTKEQPILENNTIDTYKKEAVDNNNTTSLAASSELLENQQNTKAIKLQSITLYECLFILWCIGSVFMLLRAMVVTLRFYSKLRNCEAAASPFVFHMVEMFKDSLRIKKHIKVVECNHVDVPMVFGYFKPYLLVPSKYLSDNKDNLYYIVLHEMCHIVRHDILKNYLWLFAKVIHWFNPLIYISCKMYQDNIELCCDKMVVDKLNNNDKYRYSQTLIDVLRMTNKKNTLPVAASFCSSKSLLRERVMTMIRPRKKSKTALVISLVLALVMVVGGFTTACIPKALSASSNVTMNEEVIKKIEKDDFVHNNVAPQTWKEEIRSDKVNIEIDASVYMRRFPYKVYEIIPQDIDQQYIDNTVSYLIGDKTLYYKDISMTKDAVENEIKDLNNKLIKLHGDKELNAIYVEQIQLRETALKNVLEDNVRFEFDTNVDNIGFIKLNDLYEFVDSNKSLKDIQSITNHIGEADLGKATPATLVLDKKTGTFRFENSGAQKLVIKKNDVYKNNMQSLSEDELHEYLNLVSEKYFDKYTDLSAGIGYKDNCPSLGMSISAYDGKKLIGDDYYSYAITYNRVDPYIDACSIFPDHGPSSVDYIKWVRGVNKDTVWPSIQMYVVSNESGILVAENIAPYSKVECISKGVEFIKFDKVKEIIRNNVVDCGEYSVPQDVSNSLVIDEIDLGYMYVSGGERQDRILTIPVWRVFGELESEIDDVDIDQIEQHKKYQHSYRFAYGCQPIMTINAIDGTIMK